MKKYLYFTFCILHFAFIVPAGAIPVIANPELSSLSHDRVVVTWSTTNEAASTEILWGAGGLSNITTVEGNSKYHYAELTGLFQNTSYQYRIKSGKMIFPPAPLFSPLTFKTLEKPTGEYLFSFAVLSDLRYAEGKADSSGSRGIPFSKSAQIVGSEISDINSHEVAFTVLDGSIADQNGGPYTTQISTNLKGILEQLKGANDLAGVTDFTSNISYKYLPVPGFHDKSATYGTDWLTNSFNPLTSNTSIEGIYGYNAASKDADSVFNYQFEYNNYNFLFLDSIRSNGQGLASMEAINRFLSSGSKKTFIFMSYPAYNPLSSADNTKDYPVDIPTTEVGGALYIANHVAFRTTLEAYKDAAGNPIVAAVISGHLGDNYKRDINGISYVRQTPAMQYPTGYSIYKVYSTGYVKTFYKPKGRDANDKPYYEFARDVISGETVSGQELSRDVLTQFWLGSTSNRNFTYSYAFIPGLGPRVLSTGPTSGESAVSLNAPILINFNKQLSSTLANDWVTIRDADGNALAVSAITFLDDSHTVLKVTHADFTIDKTYIVTVDGSKVKDTGLSTMGTDYVFSFNTSGGTKDVSAPTASINPLPSNSSGDPFPQFTGIATDLARVIVVEYRYDNTGSWSSTEAVEGKFSGTTEVFQIKTASPLSTGLHQLWLRTYDGIGNTSAEGFLVYSFTVVEGDKPSVSSVKLSGNRVYPGDAINATPKLELMITSGSQLQSGRVLIDGTSYTLTFTQVDLNYYATLEVTTALSDGTHSISIEALDVNGNSVIYEVTPLYVQAAAAADIQGTPLSFPNPFDPGSQTTAISYSLTKTTDITLTIHDLAGNTVAKKNYTANDSGGRVGYNEVTWDGKSDAGDYVGNGIYIYLIAAEGKIIARGKLTVLKR